MGLAVGSERLTSYRLWWFNYRRVISGTWQNYVDLLMIGKFIIGIVYQRVDAIAQIRICEHCKFIYWNKNTKRMSLLMKREIFFLELLVCTNKFRSSGKRRLVIWSVICGRKGFRVPTWFFYDHRRSKDGLTLSITIIIIIRRHADTSHGFTELTMTQGTWKLMTLWPWRQSL